MRRLNKEIIASRYRRFAKHEAHGRSGLYEELCLNIANDEETLRFLAILPEQKQQPNLLLASYRFLFGTPEDWSTFRENLLADTGLVREIMISRTTQTNEPGRCAVILPILSRLPQPIAIVEVGASAGLCLLPDRYGYDYGSLVMTPNATSNPPVFPCRTDTALETCYPEIAWRGGLDLNPLDLNDQEARNWLELLVWPEQESRRERLHKAIELARIDPPIVHRGNLMEDLSDLLDEVPSGLTTVVFHSAVLNYLSSQEERDSFASRVVHLTDYWISNESPFVLPSISPPIPMTRTGDFLLSCNAKPVAWTSPHGAYLHWL